MSLTLLLPAANCSADEPPRDSPDSPNYLAEASEGEVLVIPLYLERGDRLPNRFRKVEGTATRSDQSLVEAAYTCPIELMWIDRSTSHWSAIVIPSENSPIWKDFPRPSDEDVIACIKSRTSETFYVAKGQRGYRTGELTFYKDRSELRPEAVK